MFTTLTNWLRPNSRKPRRRTRELGAPIEALEDRVVLNSTYYPLFPNAGTFAEDWTANYFAGGGATWANVPSIEGFSGAGLGSAGTNPSGIVTTAGSQIITADLTDPDNTSPGGIGEFEIADPVVALAGDGTNSAPYLVMYLDTRTTGDVSVSYTLRDIDGSNRSVVSQVALQYRVSSNGNFSGIDFVNVPAGYVSDASTGGTTRRTDVTATLPPAANNQQFVQVRVISIDCLNGNGVNTADEWIGVDDIFVHGNLQPVISINSTTLDYIENAPITFLDPSMGLSDVDSNDFQGGQLIVNYAAVPTADDRILVNNQGTGIGQISWTGSVAAGLSIQYTTAAGTATIGTANANGGVATTPLIITFTSSAATVPAVRALLRNIGYLNVSDDPVSSLINNRIVQFTMSDGDSSTGQTSATATRRVNVIPVNDSPVVTLPGGNQTIPEGSAPINIDPTATIVDPDSHDYAGGTLTVSFPGVGAAAPTIFDQITIQNQGTGAGEISVDLMTSEVSYTGVNGTVVIGTFVGGLNGAPLVITFNALSNPTPATIQAVARAIQYQNTSDNPPANPRPIRFVAFDNDADAYGTGISANAQVTVTIQPINDIPVFSPAPRAGFPYLENDAPTPIDAAMGFVDPDSIDFSSGTLVADFINGTGSVDDRLTVANQGTGIGQVSVNLSSISYNFGSGPVVVGTITSSGVGLTRLQVTFNPSATQPAVLAVLRAISYSNVSDDPSTTPRTVRIVLGDGDTGFSTPVTSIISVDSVNDAPTIAGVPATLVTYKAGFPAAVVAPASTVIDPDSPNFGTGNFTVSSTGAPLGAADVIGIRNQGPTAGRIGLNGTNVTYGGVTIGSFSGGTGGTDLVVSLNASATPVAVQALAEAITFRTPNGVGVTGIRTISFTALDFNGGDVSNIATTNVNVTSTALPNDDFYETTEDITLTVDTTLGVLANDPSGSSPVVTLPPTKGTVTLAADGSFQYVPAPDANGTDTFLYQWTDTSGALPASRTAMVTIIINAVNDAPIATFTPAAIVVNEDSPTFSQAAFAVFSAGPTTATDELGSQTVTRTISISNPSLFSSQPAIDASGRLTFTPAANQNGSATVTVFLTDSGGTFGNINDDDNAQYTFTITVNAVNDIPSFQTVSAQVNVLEDAGPSTFPGFAFNYRTGPVTATDEVSQVPTYILTPIGGTLTFTVDPRINAAGDLSFTAAPNANGTASFIVQVQDSGGTSNGGVDLSAPRTITIVVGAVDDPPTAGNDSATVIWNSDPNPIAVLANDSGAPDAGDTVKVTSVIQPANGTVVIQSGGTGVTYQPVRGFVGTDDFTYTASDPQGNPTVATVTVNVIRYQTQPVDVVAVGSGLNGGSKIRIYNSKTGQFVGGFSAYPNFQGGVSVAAADVNGDGVTDVIVGAGVGGGPHIQIVDGNRFGLLQGLDQIAPPSALIANFFGYAFDFRGGVTVASGDVNGDGKSDIILGTGPGGAAHVKIISGAMVNDIGGDFQPRPEAVLASFFAFDPSFRGGVQVATGDVNSDGYFDVLAAAGPGGASHIKAFSGRRLVESHSESAPGVLLASFYGFDPNFRGGATLAAGDLNGDGYDDFIIGAGPGGGSHVKVFSPFNLATPIASFFAFEPGFNGGVNVGFRMRSGGSSPLLLAGSGAGSESRLATFAPPTYTTAGTVDIFDDSFMGGVDVG